MKKFVTQTRPQSLLIAGAAALLLFATPLPTSAKERRSAEAKRPSHGASATRPATTSSSSGSASSGRTRVGSSTSGRSATPQRRGSGQAATSSSSRRSHASSSSGARTRVHDSVGRHRHPHRGPHSYRYSPYRYRGHYGYRYVPYYGWVYGSDWAYDSYWGRYYRPFWGGWWGSYWDWFFYTGYTPRATRVAARSGGYVSRSGALDLDVSPEEAEIWIDGEYLGQADDYDGFPEYLWLPAGDVTVTYYLDGYETLTRDYTLRPGDVRRVRDKLRPGNSVHPRDLYQDPEPTRNQPRPYSGASTYREDREIRNSERRGEAERRRAAEEGWREREARTESGEGTRPAMSYEELDGVGRLHLTVDPDDASVYLDGVFLGLARELSQLSAGLVVAPGDHVLQIVRPGYEDESEDFSVESEESIEIEIALDRD